MNATHPTVESLLSHTEWVRALARSLVTDPGRAEDVAQQSMVAAVARAPRLRITDPRAWLARVVRNEAAQSRRAEARRAARERAAARREADASVDPAVVVQRASMHKQLVDTLFQLDDPYRTVLILRYFDGLDAAGIARRVGRPTSTVRTQIQRGLAQLRERLDGEFGDRAGWQRALAPLAAFGGGAGAAGGTSVGIGALVVEGVMVGGVLVGGVLVGVVLAAVVALRLLGGAGTDGPAPERVAGNQQVAAGSRAPRGAAAARVELAARAAVAEPGTHGPETTLSGLPLTSPPEQTWRGEVVDVDGRTVPGIRLVHDDRFLPHVEGGEFVAGLRTVPIAQLPDRSDDEAVEEFARGFVCGVEVADFLRGRPVRFPETVSRPDGSFVMEGVRLGATYADLVVGEGDPRVVYGVGFRAGAPEVPVVVVGPGHRIEGRVVEAGGGMPLQGASLSIGLDVTDLPGVGPQFDRGDRFRRLAATTDAGGRFVLEAAPRHPSIMVQVHAAGFVWNEFASTAVSPVECALELRRRDGRPKLEGLVLRHDGAPATDAVVHFGYLRVETDLAGRFEAPVRSFDDDSVLVAYEKGAQPFVLEGFGRRISDDPRQGAGLLLRIGPPALEIRGRVVDAAGEPVRGLTVGIYRGGLGLEGGSTLLERSLSGSWAGAAPSDAEGRFVVRGLRDTTYVIQAYDRETLLTVRSGPVPAGTTDLELTMPRDGLTRVEGRVVDRRGIPVADAKVAVSQVTFEGPKSKTWVSRDDVVRTDAAGAFRIEDCPRRDVELLVSGEGLEQRFFVLGPDVRLDGGLEIAVDRLLRFTLSIDARTAAAGIERFAVRDADGKDVRLLIETPGQTHVTYRAELVDARRPLYKVGAEAAELVVYRGSEIVRRMPLTLTLDGINRIDV